MNLRRLLPLLRLATKLVDKMPEREDGLLRLFAKGLAAVDAIHAVYGSPGSYLRDLKERHGLVARDSETFVRIFFSSACLREAYPIERITVDEGLDVLRADVGGGHAIYFRETHYFGAQLQSDFLHTPGLDFNAVIATLWAAHPSGVYLSVATAPSGYGRETNIMGMPPVTARYVSEKGRERIAEVAEDFAQARADGDHWSYLCIGPPGTGKSICAVLLAQKIGGRILKLDAASLPLLPLQELDFLIDVLRPDVFVIDDVDRAPMAEVGARVLFMLELLKATHPQTALVLTCNDIEKIDPAILRPDRIDEALEFDVPDQGERYELAKGLIAISQPLLTAAERYELAADITNRTTGWTHAYIANLVARVRRKPLDRAVATVERLRALAAKAAGAGKGDSPPGGKIAA